MFKFLKINGYHGTGTVRENRLPKNCPMTKLMLKKERRDTESAIEKNSDIFLQDGKIMD